MKLHNKVKNTINLAEQSISIHVAFNSAINFHMSHQYTITQDQSCGGPAETFSGCTPLPMLTATRGCTLPSSHARQGKHRC